MPLSGPLRSADTPPALRVVVVGGGAAGVLATAALARRARPDQPVEIRVVEREDLIGPGLAYGKADPDLCRGADVPAARHGGGVDRAADGAGAVTAYEPAGEPTRGGGGCVRGCAARGVRCGA
jgi:FAD-NAD(P)-binding